MLASKTKDSMARKAFVGRLTALFAGAAGALTATAAEAKTNSSPATEAHNATGAAMRPVLKPEPRAVARQD